MNRATQHQTTNLNHEAPKLIPSTAFPGGQKPVWTKENKAELHSALQAVRQAEIEKQNSSPLSKAVSDLEKSALICAGLILVAGTGFALQAYLDINELLMLAKAAAL